MWFQRIAAGLLSVGLLCGLTAGTTHAAAPTVRYVVAGGDFACALKTDATVWCWGDNEWGQLGSVSPTSSPTPLRVANLPNVWNLEAGDQHICAITITRDLYCWGYNIFGQLGFEPGNKLAGWRIATPRKVSLTEVSAVSAGVSNTCAVIASGAAYCWGGNAWGSLGDGTTKQRAMPTKVKLTTTVTSITAGAGTTCALSTATTVWCWGFNVYGALGIPSDVRDHWLPEMIKNFTGVSMVRTTSGHVCATKSDKTAWCWGKNNHGELGIGTFVSPKSPQLVKGISGAAEVRPGKLHTCFVRTNGLMACAGYNGDGELGFATPTGNPFSTVAGKINVLTAVTNASSGNGFTCAVQDGAAWCWGVDDRGQLGDGKSGLSRRTPELVVFP